MPASSADSLEIPPPGRPGELTRVPEIPQGGDQHSCIACRSRKEEGWRDRAGRVLERFVEHELAYHVIIRMERFAIFRFFGNSDAVSADGPAARRSFGWPNQSQLSAAHNEANAKDVVILW